MTESSTAGIQGFPSSLLADYRGARVGAGVRSCVWERPTGTVLEVLGVRAKAVVSVLGSQGAQLDLPAEASEVMESRGHRGLECPEAGSMGQRVICQAPVLGPHWARHHLSSNPCHGPRAVTLLSSSIPRHSN